MEQTDISNHKSIRVEVGVKTEITIKDTIKIGTDQITNQRAETKDNRDKTEVGLDMNKIIAEVILEEMLGIMADKTVKVNSYRNNNYNRSRNRPRERSFFRNYGNNRTRSPSNSRSRSEPRASTNRDRICCYKCWDYDHFTRDCPTSREEKEIEQLQQMLNLGDEQLITPPMSNMQSSEENLRAGHSNL